MSARKLGRLAGFVLVLAVTFGGAGVAALGLDSASGSSSAVEVGTLEWGWE